jgi:hypothetical protein
MFTGQRRAFLALALAVCVGEEQTLHVEQEDRARRGPAASL